MSRPVRAEAAVLCLVPGIVSHKNLGYGLLTLLGAPISMYYTRCSASSNTLTFSTKLTIIGNLATLPILPKQCKQA